VGVPCVPRDVALAHSARSPEAREPQSFASLRGDARWGGHGGVPGSRRPSVKSPTDMPSLGAGDHGTSARDMLRDAMSCCATSCQISQVVCLNATLYRYQRIKQLRQLSVVAAPPHLVTTEIVIVILNSRRAIHFLK
jgi:hypothetical protein